MRFRFRRDDTLPRLAWCARMATADPVAEVLHGPWVETADGFFAEGAWDAPFAARRPDLATACVGSAGIAGDDAAVFVTPTHMLERLHAIRTQEALVISNSLPFALAAAGDRLDPEYRFYDFDLMSSLGGLRRYGRGIRTDAGRLLEVFYHCNVHVDSDLSIRTSEKRVPPPFGSYDDYVGFLRSTVASLHDNATAAGRRQRYAPLATVSTGYDSPACALFAIDVGCEEAVTFAKARPGYAAEDDSGVEIADRLGLRIIAEFDRGGYQEMPGLPEAEFLASGPGGEEVVFAPLEGVLPRRVFFTGYLGDLVWNRKSTRVTQDLPMVSPGGCTFGEFRLRVGFVHLPLPAIGYIQHPSIYAISNSREMAPWSTGTDYDRPIPRRLLEERGVPREMFGRHKMAITQPLWNAQRLAAHMAPASYASLVEYASRVPPWGRRARLRFALLRLLYELNLRVNWRLERLGRRIGFRAPQRPIVPARYSQPMGLAALTLPWGVSVVQERYASAVRAWDSRSAA